MPRGEGIESKQSIAATGNTQNRNLGFVYFPRTLTSCAGHKYTFTEGIRSVFRRTKLTISFGFLRS